MLNQRPSRNRLVRRVLLGVTGAVLMALLATTIRTSEATGAGSGQADVPRADTPVAVNGRVYAGAQVSDRVLIGGSFTLVEPTPGAGTINQPYLYVYDVNSGTLDANQFVFDGRVNVIIPAAEPDYVYVGGKFNTINGVTKRKVAKLNLADGTVDTSFTAQGNGSVADLALSGDTLYATGGFTSFNAVTAVGLGALDPITGAVDTSFDLALTTYIGQVAGPIGQRLGLTPDENTLVVMHRARYVDGQERRGVAMIDLSTTPASLGDWQTDFWNPTSVVSIVDGEISPDGTYFVVVGGWGDSPPWRDTAIAFPVAGGAGTDELWVTRNHDSTFAVGIDDNAVYIGGHFCWTEGPTTPDPWGSPSPTGGCPNKIRQDPTQVYRDTFAALDPATGRAVKYAPYTDANNGIRSIEVIPRGLLVGGDQTWTNEVRTGRSAFFDSFDARENLALHGVATQSSTQTGRPADLAIDGLHEGQAFAQSLAHTTSEVQPWWQVDLGATESIGSIELWNRTDCCEDRLSDVWVFTSESPFASDDPNVLSADPNVSSVFTAGQLSRQTILNIGESGRYVRVQLDGTNYLTLAEVQVYDTDALAPSAAILAPTEDEVLSAPIATNGTATDDTAVTAVKVQVRNRDTGEWFRSDGTWGSWQELDATLASPGSPNTTWTFDIATAPPARYKLSARAIDSTGNSHTWVDRKFEVSSNDVIPPDAAIASPTHDEVVVGATFDANGTATDNVAVETVLVSVRDRNSGLWLQTNGTFGTWIEHQATLGSPGLPSTTWNFSAALPAGSYRIYTTAVDTSGIRSATVNVRFLAN